jgi:hypothetical protein
MTINKRIIAEFERTYRRFFPNDLKRYLLTKYSQEPFPHEFSEQDLYTNIEKDIRAYEAGELEVTTKSPSQRWKEERETLVDLYMKKCREISHLEEYIANLEHSLSDNGINFSKIAERQADY